MSTEERVDRVIDAKYPIYRKSIPELGIVKDCYTSLSIKNLCRGELRRKLAAAPALIEQYEKELCLH